jgi:hypothetical protein
MEIPKEQSMRTILAASPALVIAGALLAAPASAQTLSQPMMNPPAAQPYGAEAMPQPYAGQTMGPPQAAQATIPQGAYLSTCKEVRMLGGTLTAFCSKGDGTWQTTQLWHADSCTGGVQNAGGQLVCGMEPQVGSSTPPAGYGNSYGSAYGMSAPPATGTYPPAYAAGPSPTYPAPAYNSYGNATTSWPNAYGTNTYENNGYGSYGATTPSQDQYYSPSASQTAKPYGY